MPRKKKSSGTGMSVRIDDKGESHVTINDPNKIPQSYLNKNKAYAKKMKLKRANEKKFGKFITRHGN